jgi:hypothetical protein
MNPAPPANAKSGSDPSSAGLFVLNFVGTFLLHAPLLRLPYFWDEAGYYIPAARDLLLTGSLVPHSPPSNAHPPLVMMYLAAWWKLAGFSILVTRSAMLLVAAFSLLGVFRLARRVANDEVAMAATACTALYPVFFAQSTMALIDLAAAGLVFWGMEAYFSQHMRSTAVWFSLAVLAKETAVLGAAAVLAWELVCPWVARFFTAPICLRERKWASSAVLLIPIAVLAAWYAYHYWRVGYVFGNPEFFRYNVRATLSPLRISLALAMRLWQAFGYLHLWVLTLLMVWAMTHPPIRDGGDERLRISVPVQFVFGVVIFAFVIALSIVGGAVLARYMLTVVPLVIILAVSTLRRRIRAWRWLVAGVCVAFVVGLFLNPPYGFSPEDNLAYRDYVMIHQDAAGFVQERFPSARVLTAWPASDEITQPYLGYVTRSLRVVRIEDFTVEEIMSAAEARSRIDVALVFSTKHEPPRPLLGGWRLWENLKTRLFGFHRDLPPASVAQLLGGQVVFSETRKGQWVAVIELERVEDARRSPPGSDRHQVTGMRFHDKPDVAPGSQL